MASTEFLSEKYLWQVTSQLKAAGMIKAVSGSKGGFVLSRQASAITLAEVPAVFDPELFRGAKSDTVFQSTNRDTCSGVVEDKLRELDKLFERVLEAENIGNLVDAYRAQQSNACFYQI